MVVVVVVMVVEEEEVVEAVEEEEEGHHQAVGGVVVVVAVVRSGQVNQLRLGMHLDRAMMTATPAMQRSGLTLDHTLTTVAAMMNGKACLALPSALHHR